MGRFIPVDPEKWAAMVIAQSDLVRYKEICDELDAECTRLKDENARLRSFSTRTIIPNIDLEKEVAYLKAEVERLTKAGDAMQTRLNFFQKRWDNDELCKEAEDWNAAKEGKQP
jgi:hypothetical protein